MKPHGCNSEYAEQRQADLLKAYRSYIANCRYINKSEALDTVVNMSASRFYVSRQRAYKVILAILNGSDDLSKMRANKREMYLDIYSRVMDIYRINPNMQIGDIVEQVISSPAPKFYLSAGSAKTIINIAKKQWSKIHLQRMRALL